MSNSILCLKSDAESKMCLENFILFAQDLLNISNIQNDAVYKKVCS